MVEQPWPELLVAADSIASRAQDRMTPANVMTRHVYPYLRPVVDQFTQTELQRRLVLVAVALQRYRRREGRPAESLAVLPPDYLSEIPADPTSGEPFRYSTSEDRYVLYSPTKRFYMASNKPLDRETGAHPDFVFHWPPLVPDATAIGAASNEEPPRP